MTLSKEADEIRDVVSRLRKGPGRKYSGSLRKRVLDWMRQAEAEAGMDFAECARALGISMQRLDAWRAEEQRMATTTVPAPEIPRGNATTAMVPVVIHSDDGMPWGPGITFSAPGGYRLEGLTLDQAIGLLRLFG